MPVMNIKLESDGCWPDLDGKSEEQVIQVDRIDVAFCAGGMASGAASVMLRIDLPDGRTVIGLTSQALFDAAARAFRGRLEYLAGLVAKGGASS